MLTFPVSVAASEGREGLLRQVKTSSQETRPQTSRVSGQETELLTHSRGLRGPHPSWLGSWEKGLPRDTDAGGKGPHVSPTGSGKACPEASHTRDPK